MISSQADQQISAARLEEELRTVQVEGTRSEAETKRLQNEWTQQHDEYTVRYYTLLEKFAAAQETETDDIRDLEAEELAMQDLKDEMEQKAQLCLAQSIALQDHFSKQEEIMEDLQTLHQEYLPVMEDAHQRTHALYDEEDADHDRRAEEYSELRISLEFCTEKRVALRGSLHELESTRMFHAGALLDFSDVTL